MTLAKALAPYQQVGFIIPDDEAVYVVFIDSYDLEIAVKLTRAELEQCLAMISR